MDRTLVLVRGALAVVLATPAAVRAYRIARLHRLLGRHAWRFIFAADRQDGAVRAGQAADLGCVQVFTPRSR